MTTVFLNGDYLPMEQAKISPMDRGFLFGDGIYEVIPGSQGKLIGLDLHLKRLEQGLSALNLDLPQSSQQWRDIAQTLLSKNGGGEQAIYIQVSRGAAPERAHGYPKNVAPTVFAFSFATESSPTESTGLKVSSCQDLRWGRCHIKSTSLLGHVMHYQQGREQGMDEVLLYNDKDELTEACSSNVFIVLGDRICTPLLDHQKLPGITRHMLLDMIEKSGEFKVEQRVIEMSQVRAADEIWLTSSRNDVAPVIELDSQPVGSGQIGPVWKQVQALFHAKKFDY